MGLSEPLTDVIYIKMKEKILVIPLQIYCKGRIRKYQYIKYLVVEINIFFILFLFDLTMGEAKLGQHPTTVLVYS
jgi:hypothetical protein